MIWNARNGRDENWTDSLRAAMKAKISKEMLEAAAKAICRNMFGDVAVHGDGRCCQLGGADGCCLKTMYPVARAALKAALALQDMTT